MGAGCQWFVRMGRGRQEAEFCGADTLAGSSYCAAHHPRIWTRPAKFYRNGGPLAGMNDALPDDKDETDTDF